MESSRCHLVSRKETSCFRVVWRTYEMVHSSRSFRTWIDDTEIIYWRNRGDCQRNRSARARRRAMSRPSSGGDLNVTRFTQVLRAKGYITGERFFFSRYVSTQCMFMHTLCGEKKKYIKVHVHIWTFTSTARRVTRRQLCIRYYNGIFPPQSPEPVYAIKRKLR